MIIKRYLAKEVNHSLIATSLILLLIFLSNQMVRYLQVVANGELSGKAVAMLALLALPHLLSMILPLSLFLAILFTYGRLYVDNEMTVLSSCGFSPQQLLKITMKFSAIVVVIVGILSLWLDPKVSNYSEQILAGNTSTVLELLTPNKFQTINNGEWIIYVDKTSRDKQNLNGIFVAEQPKANQESQLKPLGIVFAQQGKQKVNHDNGNLYLVLENGHRYEGSPGKKEFKSIKYGEYGIKLQQKVSNIQSDEDTASTYELWNKRQDLFCLTELQWRISMPISAIVLILLGTALSKINSRKNGRYSKLFPATIAYIIYVQLLFLSRAWMKKAVLSPILGMWWVHGLFLIFAIVLLLPKRNK